MRLPTKSEITKFHKACEILNELGEKGFILYLNDDAMHLMVGETHDERDNPKFQNSIECHTIVNSGGGGW